MHNYYYERLLLNDHDKIYFFYFGAMITTFSTCRVEYNNIGWQSDIFMLTTYTARAVIMQNKLIKSRIFSQQNLRQ